MFVLPTKEAIELKCFGQEEIRNVIGTFLVQIPISCQITTSSKLIVNEKKLFKSDAQPILFPDLPNVPKLMHSLNLGPHLKDINLDSLHQLTNELVENRLTFSEIRRLPSLGTILIYAMILAGSAILAYKKLAPKIKNRENRPEEEPRSIQLPCLA